MKNKILFILFLIAGIAWGQTEILTITRASFPSGALAYGTDDLWTATTSEGDVVTGYFDLFSNADQTTMQTRTNTPIGSYPYNVVAIPGNITKITLTGGGTGTARAWTPYLSTTPLTKSNYTTGYNQGTKTAANNSASTVWEIDANEDYTYFYLNMTGGAAYLNSIVIEFESAPAVPTITTDLTSLNINTTVGTTVTSDIVVTGALLTSDISVAVAGDGFSVNPTTLGSTGGILTVTYNPAVVGTHSGTITLSNVDADDVVVSLNGTATLATPVATDATTIGSDSFTANWNAVAGAESYEIDVYTSEDGGSVPINVVGWDFTDEDTIADSGIAENQNRTITTNTTSITWLIGSGTPNPPAISSSGWDNGSGSKHWTVSFTTAGISNMKLSSIQRSSNTGPKDFKVQYSLDASNWTDVPGASITVANNFTTGILSGVTLPVECDNQPIVYLRWIMTSDASANNGEVAVGGTSAIDDIIINGEQGGLSIIYHLENQNVGNVTSYEVTGLDPETTYYYVVRAVAGAETSANSNEIEVTTTAPSTAVTWTGTEWINGTPSIDEDVVIEGVLFVGNDFTSFEAKSLTVVSTGAINIESGRSVTVAEAIDNQAGANNFIVESGAYLVQINPDATNVGEITVERNSAEMIRQDGTYWSSPVAGQNVKAFSNGTLNNRFYIYNNYDYNSGNSSRFKAIFVDDATYPMPSTIPTEWYEDPNEIISDNLFNPATYTFKPGWGYSIRVPNNWSSTTPAPYPGEFVGVPHNGEITVPVYGEFTMVGNPYPSTISTTAFFTENTAVKTLHFWTHYFPVGDENYSNNYVTLTRLGVAGLHPDETTTINSEVIEVAQGFIVQDIAKEDGTGRESEPWTISFNNTMRSTDSGLFIKNADEVEKHRFWISLTDAAENKTAQILVGYMTGATQEYDRQIDGHRMGGAPLYSLINDEKFTVQGRALPFSEEDIVPLGFTASQEGSFTLSLDKFDGLFEDHVTVYVKDNATDTLHNLTEGDYMFESAEGEFPTRFEIVYKEDEIMNTQDLLANSVQIYRKGQDVVVESKTEKILSVELFDMSGRNLHRNTQVNAHIYQFRTLTSTQILVVKVLTQDGEIISKKILNK